MVADFRFFTLGNASPPTTRPQETTEDALVVWRPKDDPGPLSSGPIAHLEQSEDTDLLCLQYLSLAYPPIEPTRIASGIPSPASTDLSLVPVNKKPNQAMSNRPSLPRSYYSDYPSYEVIEPDDSAYYLYNGGGIGSQEVNPDDQAGYEVDEGYEDGSQEEEEYVNNGWQDFRDHDHQRHYDPNEPFVTEQDYLHAGLDGFHAAASPSQYSSTSSQTRFDESQNCLTWQHPSELHTQSYPQSYPQSSSPDGHPFSGTLCEPTSSLPVQTSDMVNEPESLLYEQWSSPPVYKLKRKVDSRSMSPDSGTWSDDIREKRQRVEPAPQMRQTSPSIPIPRSPQQALQSVPPSPSPSSISVPQSPNDGSEVSQTSSQSASRAAPQKRKRSNDMHSQEAAQRTLKKPFRAPAPKVVLAKVTRRHSVSPPLALRNASASAQDSQLSRSAPAGRYRSPSQDSSPQPVQRAFLASLEQTPRPTQTATKKAFRTPLFKPLPARQIGLQPIRPKARSANAILAELEKEAQTLRQAVKYQTDIAEDDRLIDLIRQWRTAGREVVEQMYDRVPRPDLTTQPERQSGSWFFGAEEGGLTVEQERWIAQCPKNEDGEPVDDEGNVIFQEAGDLMRVAEEGAKGRAGENDEYLPASFGTGARRPKTEAAEKEWNMGTMMLRFSVDPALLGWDDDLEDWAEVVE